MSAAATDPARLVAARKPKANPFEVNQEGKLLITDGDSVGREESGDQVTDDMDTNEVKTVSFL